MSSLEWAGLEPDIALSHPCSGEYGWRRFTDTCRAVDRDHAHLHLSDDGLTARVPFCCRSQEGTLALVALLAKNGSIDPPQAAAVPKLPAFGRLPVAMTEAERAALQDLEKPGALERYYVYAGV